MSTAISTAGTYGAGEYYLSANISGPLVVSGRLDLNGKTVIGTSSGNTWDYGVTMPAANSLLFDSVGGGKITNFRVGAKLDGAASRIVSIDLSMNRYIGAWLGAAACEAIDNFIDRIEGVTDEPYTEGIHVAGNNCKVRGNRLLNIYKQPLYTGSAPGEGVAINAASDWSGGEIFQNVIANDTPELASIGIFGGGVDNHIHHNIVRNFWKGVAQASDVTGGEINHNLVWSDLVLAESFGIFAGGLDHNVHHNHVRNYWRGIAQSKWNAPQNKHNTVILDAGDTTGGFGIGLEVTDAMAVYRNIVSGYAAPYYGNTPTTYNVSMTFPGFIPDPPPGVAAVRRSAQSSTSRSRPTSATRPARRRKSMSRPRP